MVGGEIEAVIKKMLVSLMDFGASEIKDGKEGCEDKKEDNDKAGAL